MTNQGSGTVDRDEVRSASAESAVDDAGPVDVLRYETSNATGQDEMMRTVPAGRGTEIVAAHEEEARKRKQLRALLMWVIVSIVAAVGWFEYGAVVSILGAINVAAVFEYVRRKRDPTTLIPDLVATGIDPDEAHRRWDTDPDSAPNET